MTDTSGRPVVKCSGKVMSMRGRKSILDPWGNYLFTVREKMLAFRTTFRGEDQGGNELFEVKNRMSRECFPGRCAGAVRGYSSGLAPPPGRHPRTLEQAQR